MKGNRLTIKTLQPGKWMDKDEALLHAAFQLLVNFIEQEKPHETLCGADPYDEEFWKEMGGYKEWEKAHQWQTALRDLYNWWTIERPKRELYYKSSAEMPEELRQKIKAWTKAKNHPDWEDYLFTEEYYFDEDNLRLHELIDLRERLWT